MKYAVVKISGLQYKIKEGDKVEIGRLKKKEGEQAELEEVLLIVDGDKIKIGEPVLKGAMVKARIEKHFLGEKLDIYKFKAKTGYRRKIGFRPQKSIISIAQITSEGR